MERSARGRADAVQFKLIFSVCFPFLKIIRFCEILTILVWQNIVQNVLCISCSDFAKIIYAQKETIFMEI